MVEMTKTIQQTDAVPARRSRNICEPGLSCFSRFLYESSTQTLNDVILLMKSSGEVVIELWKSLVWFFSTTVTESHIAQGLDRTVSFRHNNTKLSLRLRRSWIRAGVHAERWALTESLNSHSTGFRLRGNLVVMSRLFFLLITLHYGFRSYCENINFSVAGFCGKMTPGNIWDLNCYIVLPISCRTMRKWHGFKSTLSPL